MTLYLVRHGRAEAGIEHLDPGLDAIGRSQAKAVAMALASSGVKRLVSSPLRRARETAQPVAGTLGLDAIVREDVSEVFDPDTGAAARGAMLGPLLSGVWSAQPPELRAFRERVLAALVELGSEPTIVVSHFVAISAAIGAATEDDRVSPCALANASITTFEVLGGKLVLKRAGEVAHLARDEITTTRNAIPGRR